MKFKLVPETLYLTVNLIDRYLTTEKKVSRPKLQLVGVTALLIASKYEEIYPPELRDLVYICDRACSKSEILEMEETILKTLDYSITIPSAHAFLVRYLKAAHADKKMVQVRRLKGEEGRGEERRRRKMMMASTRQLLTTTPPPPPFRPHPAAFLLHP